MPNGLLSELTKCSSYYASSIDLDLISSVMPYTALKKAYVIFICTFESFQEKRHLYTFAKKAKYPLVKELHKKVNEVKQNKEMEVEYMTLLQRDRENMEQGEEKMAALTKLLLRNTGRRI